MQKCPKCSGIHIDQGKPYSDTGRTAYRSDRFHAWKQPFATIPQRAYVCLQCGYTETYTDFEALKRKLPQS